jgi:hypothetical protein
MVTFVCAFSNNITPSNKKNITKRILNQKKTIRVRQYNRENIKRYLLLNIKRQLMLIMVTHSGQPNEKRDVVPIMIETSKK